MVSLVMVLALPALCAAAADFMFVGSNKAIFSYKVEGSSYTKVSNISVEGEWLALHPSGKFLYSTVKTSVDVDGSPSGQVVGYSIDGSTGALTALNTQPSGGPNPTALALDSTGKFLVVANYDGGSVGTSNGVTVLPILTNGELGEATGSAKLTGSSTNENRQKGPHAHHVVIQRAEGKEYIFIPDLGSDVVWQFVLTAEGKLEANTVSASVSITAGAGPRHMTFHPSLDVAYVLTELGARIFRLTFKPNDGTLQYVDDQPILGKEGDANSMSAAEVQVSADGKRLYASVRGDANLIGIFDIDDVGALTFKAQLTGLSTPRFFDLSPDQSQLFVCNQNGNENVVVYDIDAAANTLTKDEGFTPLNMPKAQTLVFLTQTSGTGGGGDSGVSAAPRAGVLMAVGSSLLSLFAWTALAA